ncbi:hypothetical protein V2647_10245 [Tenacibaculum maritimum]|uniref:tetratricopeptide repeat protein n=1 Tax=Tenacibaculum maritimum TaxID=107401 RepID=UPI00387650B3
MRKALLIIKIIFSTLVIISIIGICYLMLFSSKEKRLSQASHFQGVYFSQKMFDVLIFQDSNQEDVYFEKSIPYNKRGDYAKGFKLLNKAVEINPKMHLGYRGWLRLVKLKDYKGCINDLKRLDSLTPDFVDAPWGENIHYLLGLAYKGLNINQLALIEFDKSIKSEKDTSWVNPNVFLQKGIIYNKIKDYNNALINLNVCLSLNNYNSPEAYFHKGISFKKLNKTDSAKICFKKAEQLYNKGYKNSDIYNEVQDELYLSDILDELKNIDK